MVNKNFEQFRLRFWGIPKLYKIKVMKEFDNASIPKILYTRGLLIEEVCNS